LRLWRGGTYAVLLTDLHMPDMDGYTLADTIRSEEARRGLARHERMPILALTANALRGEAMRAQAAGMDEYLTKPLQLRLLKAALAKWLPRNGVETIPAELSEDAIHAPHSGILDVGVLKNLVGEDAEVVREFLSHYRTASASLATEMRVAGAAADVRQVSALAHKLKSSSRSVGALALGDLCAELENACRSGKRENVAQGMVEFEAALRAVHVQIDRHLARS
jgi:HPt (histidine-containing phosphotransfer) domain-containing protein